MAVYVEMVKVEDNEQKVVYKFGPNKKYMGIMEFYKMKKEFKIQEHVNDGIMSNESYERWAAERIVRVMYREGGNFPETMYVEK